MSTCSRIISNNTQTRGVVLTPYNIYNTCVCAYTQIRGPISPRVHVKLRVQFYIIFYIPAIKNDNNNNDNNSKNGNKLENYVYGFDTDGAHVAVGNVAGFRGGH